MQLSLIMNDKIISLNLPKVIYGSYWLSSYDDNNIFNVEEYNGKWILKSNHRNKIIDDVGNIIESIILNEYEFNIARLDNKETALIYVSPIYDFTFSQYRPSNSKIIIGNNMSADINYDNRFVEGKHASLEYDNNKWKITDYSKNLGLFVNKTRKRTATLDNGDIIFIMGLKIVILEDTLFINNPNNIKLKDFELIDDKLDDIEILEDDDETVEFYKESDYFYRSPRFKTVIEKETMVIDPPPSKQQMDETPIMLLIGPMLTMGMMSMMSLFTSLQGVWSGDKNFSSSLPGLIVGISMLASMMLWPSLNRKYQKKQQLKKEKERQEKYGDYIEKKSNEIVGIMKEQKQILMENNITNEECAKIILTRNRKLWERKYENDDFLNVRLGMGTLPVKLDIKYPEEHFTMDDDNLRNTLNTLVYKSKDLDDVPISVSLTEKYILALVGKKQETLNYIKHIALQLVTFHGYNDLKLIFLIDSKNANEYEWAKILPHVWNNNKSVRYFAENYDEMQYISSILIKELQKRTIESGDSLKDYKNYKPYYIIITDNYAESKNIEIVNEVLKQKKNIGFNIIVINELLSTLPDECTAFINVNNGNGGIFESELISTKQREFSYEKFNLNNFTECCQKLANTPIKLIDEMYQLPNEISFLEMYNVGKVEQLNSLDNWKNNNTIRSMQVPIGIDTHNMLFKLDIHEKMHGPHGLIAGMTGSGKSELIITYVLSLAVTYHPYDVSFILIDYKGGGLAGAFKNDDLGVKLPHLAGTITNLDTAEMNRSLVSIQSELRRRQTIFNKTRDALNEGVIDIYKYQKLYHEGLVDEPIPHLLIITDEFAELKANQPEFMDQLISTARIGRSLGVHLILATQKPSGVVNDQIWSNSRFKICLKVQDKSDSQDMIKMPNAAEIKQAGRFYLQVGYNEFFALGQSAWCGAPYIPTDTPKKKINTSIDFVSNVGIKIKEVDEPQRNILASHGEQITNVVRYLSDIAKKENIKIKQLWLDKIAPYIVLSNLIKKYNYTPVYDEINPIIGEFDDPFNQRQDLLTLNLSECGNTVIYGSSGSGTELLINTLIYSIISVHGVEEINFYILDFGSESLKIFSKAPQMGDILYQSDKDKITNLFKLLNNELSMRKKILSAYGGEYKLYKEKCNKLIPMITVIINNYDVFNELYSDYEDEILYLSREGFKYRIIFVLSASSSHSIRYKLLQNFKEKLVLQLNDESEYYSILEKKPHVTLTPAIGRGLIYIDDVYEFQTAHICEDVDRTKFINDFCNKLSDEIKERARSIPMLPAVVTFNDIKGSYKNLTTVPIGISKDHLEVITYNFDSNYASLITSNSFSNSYNFVNCLIQELRMLSNVHLVMIDTDNIYSDISGIDIIRENIEGYCDEYIETMTKCITAKSNNDSSYKKDVYTITLIIGFEQFNKLSSKKLDKFYDVIKESRKIKNGIFIFNDVISNIKNVEYNEWYRNLFNNKNAIWIGNGIAEQYSLKLSNVTKDLYDSIGNNYGYIVEDGMTKLIKIVEKIK